MLSFDNFIIDTWIKSETTLVQNFLNDLQGPSEYLLPNVSRFDISLLIYFVWLCLSSEAARDIHYMIKLDTSQLWI